MVQRATWFGDRAVHVQATSPAEREAIASSLDRQLPAALIRRGMASVLIESPTPEPELLMTVELALRAIEPSQTQSPELDEVRMDVVYNGADLAATADFFHITRRDLIGAHTSQTWRVAMMGFAPGFGYLEPCDDLLLPWASLPRRDNPRAQVPTGSVAIAAGMSAVYPSSSPGGWHLLGATATKLFDATDPENPALLRSGQRVRFFALDHPSHP